MKQHSYLTHAPKLSSGMMGMRINVPKAWRIKAGRSLRKVDKLSAPNEGRRQFKKFHSRDRKTAASIDGVSKTPTTAACCQGNLRFDVQRLWPSLGSSPPRGGGSERSMWGATAPKQLCKREPGRVLSYRGFGSHWRQVICSVPSSFILTDKTCHMHARPHKLHENG